MNINANISNLINSLDNVFMSIIEITKVRMNDVILLSKTSS